MKKIEFESAEVAKVAEVVKEDEKIAGDQADEAKSIADECNQNLAEAMPVLNQALKSLDTLTCMSNVCVCVSVFARACLYL